MTRDELAAELRARAEKARVENWANWRPGFGAAEALDEAASLVEALRSPARDDLADELDDLADRLPFGSPTVSRAVLDEDRRNLRNAAEALRFAPSEARVGGWEVRSEGMYGEPPHACKIEAALNEPASPDPAPDRVAEGRQEPERGRRTWRRYPAPGAATAPPPPAPPPPSDGFAGEFPVVLVVCLDCALKGEDDDGGG